MTFMLLVQTLVSSKEGAVLESCLPHRRQIYLVGLAVAILQGAFRRGAACSLNNTGSQILKNVVSLSMAFGFSRQTVGTVDLLRSDPGTGSTSFTVHFH